MEKNVYTSHSIIVIEKHNFQKLKLKAEWLAQCDRISRSCFKASSLSVFASSFGSNCVLVFKVSFSVSGFNLRGNDLLGMLPASRDTIFRENR
jgi:hypothetical protein